MEILQNKTKRHIVLGIIGLCLILLLFLVSRVLIPFIIALILAYILNPVVEKMKTRLKLPRSLISAFFSILIFLLILSVPLYIIPTIILQLKNIVSNIPGLINLFNDHILAVINSRYNLHLNLDIDTIKHFLVSNISTVYNKVNVFSPLAHNSFVIIEILVYSVLIPFILFFAINNWHHILNFSDELIPRNYLSSVHNLLHDIDKMLSAYLRGQISVMLIMALYYATALNFIDLSSGIVVGVITGMLVFIPYLGILTGFILAMLIGFASFDGMHGIVAILVVFAIGHFLESGLITPFLVGGKLGLNPIMLILALMIFGKLFGITGVLFALPLAAIFTVVLRHLRAYYLSSKYYNETN